MSSYKTFNMKKELNKRKNVIKKIHYETDSDEDSDDEVVDINKNIYDILNPPIYTTDQYTIHFPEVSKFITKVKKNPYNNKLNREHKKQLTTAYKKNKPVHGVFYTGTDKYGHIYLLEGHHRFEALKLSHKKKPNNEPVIQVHNYMIDTINSARTRELFNIFNKVKPFFNDEELTRHVHSIIIKLQQKYPGCFKEGDNTQKPHISIPKLKEALEKYIKDNDINPHDINDDDFVDKIDEKNDDLADKTLKQLKEKYCKRLTDNQYDKMNKKNFYMSLIDLSEWSL